MIIGKPELVDNVSRRVVGVNKDVAKQVVDAFLDVVTNELAEGNEVRIIGFGTFKTGTINPTNPQTGEKMGNRQVPRFSAGQSLKDAVHPREREPDRGW